MKVITCKCGSTSMKVEQRHQECAECPNNGWYDSDPEVCEYKYEEEGRKSDRTEAQDEGECGMGTNWDAGCSLYICNGCGKTIDFVPYVDGC